MNYISITFLLLHYLYEAGTKHLLPNHKKLNGRLVSVVNMYTYLVCSILFSVVIKIFSQQFHH